MTSVADELGMNRAAIGRAAGIPPGRIRQYVSAKTDNPRGDEVRRIAAALGVEYLWLRDGIGPKRRGDGEGDPVERVRANQAAQHDFGGRMRDRREALGMSIERATAGLAMSTNRWSAIETGSEAPDLIELQVIAERLRESLDWLVSGIATTPIDAPIRPAQTERTLHDPDQTYAHRLPPGVKK